jgi:predicted aspartyl protease
MSSTTRVSFRLAAERQPLILIPTRVNGRGPYDFVLDTGAGACIVSESLAQELALERRGQASGRDAAGEAHGTLAGTAAMAVGEMEVPEVALAIADFGVLARTVRARLDGVLGYGFVRHLRLTIDYHAQSLTLIREEGGGERTPAGETIPFRIPDEDKPLVVVPGRANDARDLALIVDTGASICVISSAVAEGLGLSAREIGPLTGGGGKVAASASTLSSLALGNARLESVDVAVSDFLSAIGEKVGQRLDGIVGYNFLRHFDVTFDYPRGLLGLVPAAGRAP